ncbi:hypothetical protein E2C01_079369 [Portunus trituberculatus]|uniref:Uncharacterized protein n=1 Tax=Portunus trituberculatus TaxID=210409 RepID=A0A5B7IWR3_PORTR|nr:hypothetical protein [Portunus trituberculatus]
MTRTRTPGQYKMNSRVRSVECLGVDSSSLLVEGDAPGALLLCDADLLQGVGGYGGDDRRLSAVAVLVSSEGDLGDPAVVEGISVGAEDEVRHEA